VTINECCFNSLHCVAAIHLSFLNTIPLLRQPTHYLHGEREAEGILQWTFSTQNRNYRTTGREQGCRRVKERKEIRTPMFYLKLSVPPQSQFKLKQLSMYP
jgi:hypothetical protein